MNARLSPLLFVALLFSFTVTAQSYTLQQTVAGGNKEDTFNEMARTSDGGFIAGGYSLSGISGDKTEPGRGDRDIWLIKYSRSGQIQWQKTIGGSGLDECRSVQQTSDGGYILGAYSSSPVSGEKTQDTKGAGDYWIIKLDAAGNIVWDKDFGSNENDVLKKIRQTPDGGFLFAGWTYGGISGDKTENSYGSADFWAVKTDAGGNKLWDRTMGGYDYDELTCMEVATDGSLVFGGYAHSFANGEPDYYIVKTNSNGTIITTKHYGGSGLDYLSCIRQTTDGGFILGGFTNSPVSFDKTEPGFGYNDYWLVKINAAGNKQWDKTFGGSQYDEMFDIQQTGDGGYIIGGSSTSPISGNKTEDNRGGLFRDYWILKIDKNRAVQWDKTIGGTLADELKCIAEINATSYVAGGYSYSGISGDKTISSRGNADYWLVLLKVKADGKVTAVPGNEENTRLFKVHYP